METLISGTGDCLTPPKPVVEDLKGFGDQVVPGPFMIQAL